MSLLKKAIAATLVAVGLHAMPAVAKDIDQVGRAAYVNALKDKRVIFIPLSQGMDLNQAWTTVWQRHAARYGFKFEVLRRQRNQIAVLRVNSVRPRSGAAV